MSLGTFYSDLLANLGGWQPWEGRRRCRVANCVDYAQTQVRTPARPLRQCAACPFECIVHSTARKPWRKALIRAKLWRSKPAQGPVRRTYHAARRIMDQAGDQQILLAGHGNSRPLRLGVSSTPSSFCRSPLWHSCPKQGLRLQVSGQAELWELGACS